MRQIRRRVWYAIRQRRFETDLAEEMEFHLVPSSALAAGLRVHRRVADIEERVAEIGVALRCADLH